MLTDVLKTTTTTTTKRRQNLPAWGPVSVNSISEGTV